MNKWIRLPEQREKSSLPILKTRDVHFIRAVYEIKNHVYNSPPAIVGTKARIELLKPFASQLIDLTSCSYRFC